MLPLMLSVNELNDALKNDELSDTLVIVDIGKSERFASEHIPGAINITPAETQRGAPIPGLIPEDKELSHLAGRIGLGSDLHLIIYDDEGGGWAGRFIWLLDEIGHPHYSYLDGGLPAWKEAGFSLEQGPGQTHRSDGTSVFASGSCSITGDALLAGLPQGSYSILDARSPQEYTGEKVSAARGGHIPGAVNYNWTNAIDAGNAMRLRPLEEIRKEFRELGITGAKTVVTHCQSHHRSGLTYLICKLLGIPVLAYPGSWGEWVNRNDTPIAQG
ncbi:MAG: thiosulfate sulfurtransferase [Oleiphilus sp.]|nr:MAG: thiosulfate sulfurtransferase [Oleiphilus sp.]